jgi:hypothetical protein
VCVVPLLCRGADACQQEHGQGDQALGFVVLLANAQTAQALVSVLMLQFDPVNGWCRLAVLIPYAPHDPGQRPGICTTVCVVGGCSVLLRVHKRMLSTQQSLRT